MKIFLSIFVMSVCTSAYGQINQKTVVLRKQYPGIPSFQLKETTVHMPFERQFISNGNESIKASILSTELYPKPSMQSIEKAFNYYNAQKKTDYSGFVMMGYSMITNKALINNTPQESIRFFPANSKD